MYLRTDGLRLVVVALLAAFCAFPALAESTTTGSAVFAQLVAGEIEAMSTEGVDPATAFTYQGRLTDGSTPLTGSYDFAFALFDAETAGNFIGILTFEDVAVVNGLFVVTLNYGSSVFAGDRRWLLIGTRPGAETGDYTELGPRQELTPTPYAIGLIPGVTVKGNPASEARGLINAFAGPPVAGDEGTYGVKLGAMNSGATVGVDAYTHQTGSIAVRGEAGPGTFLAAGVMGMTESPFAYAVMGMATALAGSQSIGGFFQSSGESGVGVVGQTNYATGENYGVMGMSSSEDGAGGLFENNKGPGTRGRAVIGLSGSGSLDAIPFYYYHAAGTFVGPNGVIGFASSDGDDGFGVFGASDEPLGIGVHGLVTSGSATAVYGLAQAPDAYAGRFSNQNGGVDIYASGSGIIRSKADHKYVISPLNAVSNSLSLRQSGGRVEAESSSTGLHGVDIPINIPSQLYGVPLRVRRIEISYKVDTASSFINGTTLKELEVTGSNNLITNSVTRKSTTWSTYPITGTELYNGPVWLYFLLNYGGTGTGHTISIGRIVVMLDSE